MSLRLASFALALIAACDPSPGPLHQAGTADFDEGLRIEWQWRTTAIDEGGEVLCLVALRVTNTSSDSAIVGLESIRLRVEDRQGFRLTGREELLRWTWAGFIQDEEETLLPSTAGPLGHGETRRAEFRMFIPSALVKDVHTTQLSANLTSFQDREYAKLSETYDGTSWRDPNSDVTTTGKK